MLDYLGEKEAANSIVKSIEKTLFDKKNRTKDLGGESNTVQCAQAVLDNL
jgi:tartrate dehydrogenase/decarboxylase/D-malate dehydrogenase